jgi:signal transduction histidine kinase
VASRFDVADAAEQISSLLASAKARVSRDELRERILGILVQRGHFDRARFYESCADIVSDGTEILVLVAATDDPEEPTGELGLCVPGDQGPIGRDKASPHTVALHTAADFTANPDWITALQLENRAWADIHLRVAGESVGAIAVDWVGNKAQITSRDKLLLAGIGTLVAQHIQLRPLHRLSEVSATIARSSTSTDGESSPLDILLSRSIPKIAHLLDARLAALFEYKWSTGRIEKTREFDTTRNEATCHSGDILVLPESYAVDQHLTGHAWSDSLYRVVPSFERLSKHLPDLVNEESAQAHTAYMGEAPLTCMYGRIDSMETRHLIRLMNRRNSPTAPYAGEKDLLQAILEEVRIAVDKATALGRTANLEKATRIAAQTSNPQEMLDALGPLLDEEDVRDALVWCHQADLDHFSFQGTHGDRLRIDRQAGFIEWRNDSLYTYLSTRAEDVDVITTGALRRAVAGRSLLFDQLAQYTNTAGALMIKLAAGDTQGILLIPLRQGSPVKRERVIDDCGVGRLSLLKAYGSLLTDVVDGSAARARADGARRALGVLGHELSTPLARLGNAAEQALREIHRATVDAPRRDDVQREIRLDESLDQVRAATIGYLNQIRAERRSIGAAMSLAPLVAQESAEGHLELQMRRCDFGEIAVRATTQASQEAADQLRRPGDGRRPVHYNFRHHESLLSLGELVGDEAFLFLAVLNVMRNAYKYSVPPTDSGVCRIDVAGLRQRDMKIITVTNVGRAIDPEQADRIFEPWVRLKDDRDNTARTGMGIGLFFSRRIALAHKGTVICTGSVPLPERVPGPERSTEEAALDRMLSRAGVGSSGAKTVDPAPHHVGPHREPALHVTTFEIRISDKLERGPYVHEWSPGYAAAKTRRRSVS